MSTDLCAWLTSQVGRVIGKNGETIKALQTYTGALIQIDQVRGASLHVVARAKSAWVLFASYLLCALRRALTVRFSISLKVLPPRSTQGPNAGSNGPLACLPLDAEHGPHTRHHQWDRTES